MGSWILTRHLRELNCLLCKLSYHATLCISSPQISFLIDRIYGVWIFYKVTPTTRQAPSASSRLLRVSGWTGLYAHPIEHPLPFRCHEFHVPSMPMLVLLPSAMLLTTLRSQASAVHESFHYCMFYSSSCSLARFPSEAIINLLYGARKINGRS